MAHLATARSGPSEIHLIGSRSSAGEFIPAHGPVENGESEEEQVERWLANGLASEVTDWHVDEPWETQAGRFTVLYMAQHSGGRSETAFVSMADFLRDGMLDEDVRLLANATGTFAPPPWLPLEVCSPHCIHQPVLHYFVKILLLFVEPNDSTTPSQLVRFPAHIRPTLHPTLHPAGWHRIAPDAARDTRGP